MTEYHQAPHTLDPNQKPPENPEDVAPAAGHDDEQAERVAELNAQHSQGVDDAARAQSERAEAGTPEPPYAAGHESGVAPEASPKASDVPEGTIADVLNWVGDDPARASQALEAEEAGQNRSTLIAELEGRT